jgi:hypothetical protein
LKKKDGSSLVLGEQQGEPSSFSFVVALPFASANLASPGRILQGNRASAEVCAWARSESEHGTAGMFPEWEESL